MEYVIRVIAIANCPEVDDDVNGMFIKSYDVNANAGRGSASFTSRKAHALKFRTPAEAFMAWREQSTTHPLRKDGEPNRPLTSYSIVVEPEIEHAPGVWSMPGPETVLQ